MSFTVSRTVTVTDKNMSIQTIINIPAHFSDSTFTHSRTMLQSLPLSSFFFFLVLFSFLKKTAHSSNKILIALMGNFFGTSLGGKECFISKTQQLSQESSRKMFTFFTRLFNCIFKLITEPFPG